MEPFFVANCLCVASVNVSGGDRDYFINIRHNETAYTYINDEDGSVDYVIIFSNSENNCYVSFYTVRYQEQFIVPSGSYYVVLDSFPGSGLETHGLLHLVRFGSSELPNVRTFFRYTKESIFLKNINIREYVN